jgi:hypothetical protein
MFWQASSKNLDMSMFAGFIKRRAVEHRHCRKMDFDSGLAVRAHRVHKQVIHSYPQPFQVARRQIS